MIKKLIGALVVVALVGGAAVWWFILRDDAPEELSVDSGGSSSQTTTGTAPASLDGTWKVKSGGDTTAGFRIKESFAGGLADHQAVGRSGSVSGSIDIADTSVSSGSFTVDLNDLEFTDDPGFPVANRVRAMQDRGLEVSTFPTATFELTAPIDFAEKPAAGKTVTASATGDLTIHGVTKSVTFDVEAKLDGSTIRVATASPVPVKLADFDITPPTGGPVASVEDAGSFEFLVVLAQS